MVTPHSDFLCQTSFLASNWCQLLLKAMMGHSDPPGHASSNEII